MRNTKLCYPTTSKLPIAAAALVAVIGVATSCRDSATTINYIAIVPGRGTEEVQVGMPAEELPKSYDVPLKESSVPLHITSRYSNPGKGVTVVCYEGHVWHAKFILRPKMTGRPRWSPFPGIVDGAITSKSTIEDVVAQLGEPSSRESSADDTLLNFERKGIEFAFKRGKLCSIIVEDPTFDSDEVHLKIRDYWEETSADSKEKSVED